MNLLNLSIVSKAYLIINKDINRSSNIEHIFKIILLL